MNYSVLMSVYSKEKPEYFYQAIKSMTEQTVKSDDIVIVCDGDLTAKLDDVIHKFCKSYPEVFNIIRIPKNDSWASVLNIGLEACKNEYIARMDSDDISDLSRCEKQLDFMQKNPSVDCVSTFLGEFSQSPEKIDNVRRLPENNKDIREFAKYRCPLNHATVMYKKSAVIKVGRYVHFPAYEDYHLWIRMIKNNCILHNIPEVLYYMRAGQNLYSRRGGYKYFKTMASFRKWMYKQGITGLARTSYLILANGAVILMPSSLRGFIYKRFLRK